MTRFTTSVIALFAVALPGLGQAGPGSPAEVEILPGWRQPDGTHMAALRIALDPGWKTYWRAPGETGIPPSFDWSGSENIGAVDVRWPIPEIMESNGVTTLGYSKELVLPIEVVPADPGADVKIVAALAFGICEDVCMPLEARVSAVLPAAAMPEEPRIAGALAARPDTAEEAAVVSTDCEIEGIADGMRVTARIEMPPLGPDEFVVVEPDDRAIWVSEAMLSREDNILTAEADLVPPEGKPFALAADTLRFTVLARGRGVDIRGCAEVR